MKLLIALILVFAPFSIIECEELWCRKPAQIFIEHDDHTHELCVKHFQERVK